MIPLAVNIIVGTNSYISVSDADAYFNLRLFSEVWTAAPEDTKAQALIMATSRIDRLTLKGKKVNTDQKLKFPRAFYNAAKFNPNDINDAQQYIKSNYGWLTESDIPDAVKNATCEEAVALLKGIPKRVELQHQGVQSFSLAYALSETYTGKKIKLLSPDALDLMRPYILGGASIV